MEKDPERGSDSLITFEEILQLAQEKKVQLCLLISYTSSVISDKYCNFIGLQECNLSINRRIKNCNYKKWKGLLS